MRRNGHEKRKETRREQFVVALNSWGQIELHCELTIHLEESDNGTAPWGHVNFGGIYQDPLKPYSE